MTSVGLKCQKCGMIYTLGVDTTVSTSLPTPSEPDDKSMRTDFLRLHAAWGNEGDPDSLYFLKTLASGSMVRTSPSFRGVP